RLEYLHERTFPLQHPSAPSLLGVTDCGDIYIEEIYGEEGWLAQGQYSPDGTLLAGVDEDAGRRLDIQPLPLPDNLIRPARVWHTMRLNFAGPRYRGSRLLERIDELVQPLSAAEKIAISQHLKLPVPPPMLLGLAESYVLAEAQIVPPTHFIVCRRLRFAYALGQTDPNRDREVDYDTAIAHIVQEIDLDDDADRPLSSYLGHFAAVALNQPMDCMVAGTKLFVADGGDPATGRLAQIHIWHINGIPPVMNPLDRIHKRLYD
ncbi:MAG: hypothetical protein NZM00_00720, partial [Anaerolinea sp.]|nr:hypothetical protein [Anaerolinea sp.]